MDIANTLKEFRQQHGMEQDELARLLGTTQQTVSNWENGTMPRAAALHRINHVLTTYKVGEGVVPPPPLVINPAISEIHGIRVRSEHEASRQTAASIRSLTSSTSRAPANNRRQLEEQMSKLLPDGLGITCNAMFEYQGLRPHVGFLTDDIVCNVTIPMLPGEPRHHSLYLYRTVEMNAMRLMTVRAIQRMHGFERKIYALIAVLPQETLQLTNPTQAMALASLHGIRLILVPTVEQGARAIESLVEEAKPSPEEDFIDDKDHPW